MQESPRLAAMPDISYPNSRQAAKPSYKWIRIFVHQMAEYEALKSEIDPVGDRSARPKEAEEPGCTGARANGSTAAVAPGGHAAARLCLHPGNVSYQIYPRHLSTH
jgi:hypothetical protein